MSTCGNITADAVTLQERDEFRPEGWTRILAPAKVNLHLAIGERLPNGYHEAATVMHALNLHDVVYMREPSFHETDSKGDAEPCEGPLVRMVAGPDIELPPISSRDNLASKAVVQLASALELPVSHTNVEIRIEKNIPSQAGLGGGSSDAAAALAGAAMIWGVDQNDPRIEEVARTLGADVAFFLRGGCAYLEGVGDAFVHELEPSKRSVALVKPEGGVSTAEAYRLFDAHPVYASSDAARRAKAAKTADDIALFNNLAAASEKAMPELADVRSWLLAQSEVESALLCGSGAATFALCEDFSGACSVVAKARKNGWWARSTSFGSARVLAKSVSPAGHEA